MIERSQPNAKHKVRKELNRICNERIQINASQFYF